MTQEQFNTIVRIISNGAPALASELIPALQDLIGAFQKQTIELDEYKNVKAGKVPAEPTKEVN